MVWNCVLHVTHARDEWFQISSENRLCTLKHTWSHVNNIQIFLISLPQATTAAALTAPATNQQQPFNQINLIHEISSNIHMTGGRRYSKRIFNSILTASWETRGAIKHVPAKLRKNNYLQGLQDFNCGVFLQSLIICIILSVVKIATATTMKHVPATHVWRHEPINEGNIKLRCWEVQLLCCTVLWAFKWMIRILDIWFE